MPYQHAINTPHQYIISPPFLPSPPSHTPDPVGSVSTAVKLVESLGQQVRRDNPSRTP